MSRLMAEMLDLNIAKFSKLSEIVLDSDAEKSSSGIDEFAEKTERGKERREKQMIDLQLRSVHERVKHVLNEAGISAELPDPCFEEVILSCRPPDFCVANEKEHTEEQKQANRTCTIFIERSRNRKALMKSVEEWMKATASLLDEKNFRILEHSLAKQENEARKSLDVVKSAMTEAKSALKKLESIGSLMFDDKECSRPERSTMNEIVQAKVNDRVRRQSIAIDSVPYNKRAHIMRAMLKNLEALPGDMTSLAAEVDEDDEEEMTLLNELSSEWKTLCNDIRDLLISVHELKILKRSAKLRIRKALYMFKLIAALLELRDKYIKKHDDELITAQSEVISLKAKLDHVHGEIKKSREKLNKTQTIVVKISKERDESRNETFKLREDLGSCIDKIAELNNLVKELKSERPEKSSKVKEPEVAASSNDQDAKKRIVELTEQCRRQENALEELQGIKEERDDLQRKLNEFSQSNKEMQYLTEQRVREAEERHDEASRRVEDLENKISQLEEDLAGKESELKMTIVELEAKNEVVLKLTTLTEQSDEESEPDVRDRRLSRAEDRRRMSMRKSRCIFEDENRNLDRNLDKVKSINQLIKTASNRLLPKSSARLLPSPAKSRALLSQPSPSVYEGVRLGEGLIPLSNTPELEADGSDENVEISLTIPDALNVNNPIVTGIPNEEYLRVRDGWEDAEQRNKELELAIADAELEIEELDRRYKKKLSSQAREFRMQMVMAEERSRIMITAVYREANNVENMMNRYKNELSVLFEKALLPNIAKNVKNVYSYNSADNPDDFESSLKITNQWLDVAFKRLTKAQSSAIKRMQANHYDLKLKAEKAVGLEIARHLQVLSEKQKETDRMKKQIEKMKKEIEQAKEETLVISRQCGDYKGKWNAALESERKIKERWRHREQELLSAGDSNAEDSKKTKKMENEVKALKQELKSLKGQYLISQRSVALEMQARMNAERTAVARNQRLELTMHENHHGNIKRKEKQEISATPSESSVYVKIINKLLTLGPTLKLSHVTDDIVQEMKDAVTLYSNVVLRRLGHLLRSYIIYKRYHNAQMMTKQSILMGRRQNNASCIDHVRLQSLDNIYWHLQVKLESIVQAEPANVRITVYHCRVALALVFGKVTKIIGGGHESTDALTEMNGLAEEVKARISSVSSDGTDQERKTQQYPIVPSNSMLTVEVTQSADTDEKDEEHIVFETEESKAIEERGKEDCLNDDEVHKDYLKEIPEVELSEESLVDMLECKEAKHNKQEKVVMVTSSLKLQRRPSQSMARDYHGSHRVFSRRNTCAPEYFSEINQSRMLMNSLMKKTSSCRRQSMSSQSKNPPETTTAGPTWNRRASIAMQQRPSAKSVADDSVGQGKITRGSQLTAEAMPEMPMALQLDVHEVLHRARKNLQNTMRRHSVVEDRPATSISDIGALTRRQTVFGGVLPGVMEGRRRQSLAPKLLQEDADRIKKTPSPKTKHDVMNDQFELNAVQPPANHFCPSSKQEVKLFRRRRSVKTQKVEEPSLCAEKPEMKSEEPEGAKSEITRSLSDEPVATEVGRKEGYEVYRRKSASDVGPSSSIQLPDIYDKNKYS